MASTVSDPASITAPSLMGGWIHATSDPEGTERNYLYKASDANETVGVQSTLLSFIGRTFPVAEFGEMEAQSLELKITVPWSPTHDAEVQAFRDYLRSRETLCWRDSRGRLMFGVFDGGVGITDVPEGSVVAVRLARVNYLEGAA